MITSIRHALLWVSIQRMRLMKVAEVFAKLLQEGAVKGKTADVVKEEFGANYDVDETPVDTLLMGFTEAEAVKLFANTYQMCIRDRYLHNDEDNNCRTECILVYIHADSAIRGIANIETYFARQEDFRTIYSSLVCIHFGCRFTGFHLSLREQDLATSKCSLCIADIFLSVDISIGIN